MNDIVQIANTHARPCRLPADAVSPVPCISRAASALPAIECPVCGSTDLAWAFRLEHPEFKSGAIACMKCGQMYDVTPRN
jgi:DNA-directed RNA polymerase subunit RPC12/RpoP